MAQFTKTDEEIKRLARNRPELNTALMVLYPSVFEPVYAPSKSVPALTDAAGYPSNYLFPAGHPLRDHI